MKASVSWEQHRREFSEQYYDPKNHSYVYLRKVDRHHAINSFLTSTRREDPRYRKIIVLLLENGYGIDEWPSAVQAILSYNI